MEVLMREITNESRLKSTVFDSFEDFEARTGILWQLRHIEGLKYIGLSLMPETDGSYRPNKAVLRYLKRFCRDNPAYHIVSETHYSDQISEGLGPDWMVRTFVNCCADLNFTRRYYLADGDGEFPYELVEMTAIAETNVIPFRLN
jgi:hypothetical protein